MISPEDFIKKVREYCDKDVNIVSMEINDNEKYHYYTLFCVQYVPITDLIGNNTFIYVYSQMNIPYKDLIFYVDRILPIIKEELLQAKENELKRYKNE